MGEHIIPTLYLHQDITQKEFKEYFNKLVISLSEKILVGNGEVRVLKGREMIDRKYSDKDYLVLVPINYEGISLNILMKWDDLYLVGVQLTEKICIFSEDVSSQTAHIKSVKSYFEHFNVNVEIVIVNVGESYGALEKLAERKRCTIELGKKSLLQAFEYLTTREIKRERVLGNTLLFITQFFCEALRIKTLARHIQKNFEGGCFPRKKYLILEHYWSAASKILLRGPGNQFELYFFDEDDEVTYEELFYEFGILKRFEGSKLNEEDKSDDFEKFMSTRYLHACFGQYIKQLETVELGTDCKITATIHILRDHVVLQYNHNHFHKNVRFSVSASDNFKMSDFQPLQNILCKTFVAFNRIGDVALSSTFSTALSVTAEDPSEPTLYFNYLKVFAKDYLRGAGIQGFEKKWNEFSKGEVGSGDINLKQNLSSEEAKKVATGLFDLKDVTSQQGLRKQRKNPGIILLHGKYMNTYGVLVKVEFIPKQETSENRIKLSCRCTEEECTAVIGSMIIEELEQAYKKF